MPKTTNRQALELWEEFRDNILHSTPVDNSEGPEEQKKRINHLEADFEKWVKYYFPKFAFAEPANFHKRSSQRILANPEWYEARPWSRELAKDTRTMFEILFLALTGKKKFIVLTSNSYDKAGLFLMPYKAQLEFNLRVINDYGIQEKPGSWSDGYFVTRKGVAFLAIGAGQSPRGIRNEEVRPDAIIFTDMDTDESVRNPDTVDKNFEWAERALISTRSVSRPLLILVLGNIIAEYCFVLKAMDKCDHFEIVNIIDENGQSSWPDKNTLAQIQRIQNTISYAAYQGEYMNNPITQGKVFKEINYKVIRSLKEYRFLVAYTDPSYKGSKKNDYKATVLVGRHKEEYHVLRMYCEQTTTARMIEWQYEIDAWVNGGAPIYFYIEWPSIDDALKLELAAAGQRLKKTIPLKADDRDKGDKFARIESLLEPLNRRLQLWFNVDEKINPHMKRGEEQFKALSPTSRAHDDFPDAVEGAVWILNNKTLSQAAPMKFGRRPKNIRKF
jgi:hypothetical protein